MIYCKSKIIVRITQFEPWENVNMCYLIAKKFDNVGCIALKTKHGKHLAELKSNLIAEIGTDSIQLVTISRPSAFGEYEPYRFVQTEQEFETELKKYIPT